MSDRWDAVRHAADAEDTLATLSEAADLSDVYAGDVGAMLRDLLAEHAEMAALLERVRRVTRMPSPLGPEIDTLLARIQGEAPQDDLIAESQTGDPGWRIQGEAPTEDEIEYRRAYSDRFADVEGEAP